jgi:squalene-hopene/tetraprenyl-beta-curcumene cyclase
MKDPPKFQYKTEGIEIPRPTAEVPRVAAFGPESVKAAALYIEQGALTWVREKSCINCHTTGPYMAERPALKQLLGPLQKEVWENFATDIPTKPVQARLKDGITHMSGHQPVWRAMGLAEWDRYESGKVSAETQLALEDMLRRQSPNGSFVIYGEVEIPYITTDYELSVQAARAVTAAPGWLQSLKDPAKLEQIEKLKRFLRYGVTRNDYDRLLKLEVDSYFPGVIPKEDLDAAMAMLTQRQHADGGWSLRDMSSVDGWSLQVSQVVRDVIAAVPDAADPQSDPYMTALAIVLMRKHGIAKEDARIRRAVAWLKKEQRQPGWWWMDSLYRGNYRYITYIATAKALTALALCDELPKI